MDTKCFRIVFDPALKDYAEKLKTLLSQVDGFKAMLQSTDKKKKIDDTDKDYWVYFGTKCSKNLSFADKFSNYGIQIGWSGTDAWIKVINKECACELLPGNMQEYPIVRKLMNNTMYSEDYMYSYYLYQNRHSFIESYLSLYKKYGVKDDDDIDYAKDLDDARKRLEKRFEKSCVTGEKTLRWSDLNTLVGYESFPIRRKRFYRKIYLYSILLFVDEYLGDYLTSPRIYSIHNKVDSESDTQPHV